MTLYRGAVYVQNVVCTEHEMKYTKESNVSSW